MDSFAIFSVSASAMKAQRERMNVTASNLANAHTTRTEEGGPYKRKDVFFETMQIGDDASGVHQGVKVSDIVEDENQPSLVYNPGHPDANAEGYVAMPNVNVIEEMVNMMMAMRAYEANVSTFNISKSMIAKTLEIGR
jgi:flagellar basal-body rod protein FlgC